MPLNKEVMSFMFYTKFHMKSFMYKFYLVLFYTILTLENIQGFKES